MRNGHLKRITDADIQSSVLEIMSTNVSNCYVVCPADPGKTLGIKLPFLVMIIKNLKKYFTFEVQVLDDKNVRRRFRASNYQVWVSPPHLALQPCAFAHQNVGLVIKAQSRLCCPCDRQLFSSFFVLPRFFTFLPGNRAGRLLVAKTYTLCFLCCFDFAFTYLR